MLLFGVCFVFQSIKVNGNDNLIPRLSSVRSSLKEETMVNAGHVDPRFWEPLGYLLLGRGGFVRYWVNVNRVTLVINCKRLELRT